MHFEAWMRGKPGTVLSLCRRWNGRERSHAPAVSCLEQPSPASNGTLSSDADASTSGGSTVLGVEHGHWNCSAIVSAAVDRHRRRPFNVFPAVAEVVVCMVLVRAMDKSGNAF